MNRGHGRRHAQQENLVIDIENHFKIDSSLEGFIKCTDVRTVKAIEGENHFL